MTLKASTLSSRRSTTCGKKGLKNMHAESVPHLYLIIMAYTKLIYHIVFRPRNNAPAITEKYERDLTCIFMDFAGTVNTYYTESTVCPIISIY